MNAYQNTKLMAKDKLWSIDFITMFTLNTQNIATYYIT